MTASGRITVAAFTWLIAAAAPAAHGFPGEHYYRRCEGSIDGRLKIIMHVMQDSGRIQGWYYYLPRREMLLLKGTASPDDGLILSEFPRGIDSGDEKNRTGQFLGTWDAPDRAWRLSGTWQSRDGKKTLPFTVTESYGTESVALTPVRLVRNEPDVMNRANPPRVEADLQYLYPQSFPDRGVLAALRKTYADPFPDDPGKSLQSLCDRFFASHREAAAEADDDWDSPMYQWALSHSRSVLLNDGGLLCQEMVVYIFSGGAHGHRTTDFKTSDLATGKEISAADIFAPGKKAELTGLVKNKARELVRKQIRDAQGVEPDKRQMDSAFRANDFELTDNFYLAVDGIGFYYNNDLITSRVIGPVDVFLPWAEARDFIRIDSPVRRLLK